MAAGVHLSFHLRGERQARLLRQRQRIHVRTQADAGAVMRAAQDASDTRLANSCCHVNSQSKQLSFDKSGRFHLLKAQLGAAMDAATALDEVGLLCSHIGQDGVAQIRLLFRHPLFSLVGCSENVARRNCQSYGNVGEMALSQAELREAFLRIFQQLEAARPDLNATARAARAMVLVARPPHVLDAEALAAEAAIGRAALDAVGAAAGEGKAEEARADAAGSGSDDAVVEDAGSVAAAAAAASAVSPAAMEVELDGEDDGSSAAAAAAAAAEAVSEGEGGDGGDGADGDERKGEEEAAGSDGKVTEEEAELLALLSEQEPVCAGGIQTLEAMDMLEAAEATGDFREMIHLVGRVFLDADLLGSSFLLDEAAAAAASGEVDAVMLSGQEPNYDHVGASAFYSVLLQSAARGSLENAMHFLCSQLPFQATAIRGPRQLRLFLIALDNPALLEPDAGPLVLQLCRALAALPARGTTVLKHWWTVLPTEVLARHVGVLQQAMTLALLMGGGEPTGALTPLLKALALMFAANEARSRRDRLPLSAFYNDAVNSSYNEVDDFQRWRPWEEGAAAAALLSDAPPSFCMFPFVLEPASKQLVLHLESRVAMRDEFRHALLRSMLRHEVPFLVLEVHRDSIVEDTLERLHSVRPQEFKKLLKVKFVGEEGVDEGGVKKEFFQIIVRRLFDPAFFMFTYDDSCRLFFFNRLSFEPAVQFELVGILLGLAIYNSVILDVRFPPIVYRLLMGQRATLLDLAPLDAVLARSLQQLLDYDEGDVEDLGFTFQVEVPGMFGETEAIELLPGGADIAVTNRNRQQFVDAYVAFKLESSIDRQFSAFKRGFMKVVSGDAFQLFHPAELELLICGSDELDMEALRDAAQYEEPYAADHAVIVNFWTVVLNFSPEQQRQLLRFATGSDRVPIKGLSALSFTITRAGPDSDSLPTSHTCFNHLLLPEYATLDKMKERLETAIANAEGFGLL
eukprot:PLAT5322.5.p1 GENE.PLAT5322.5~~PLAT5322.5.p1  ORF type:complete len:971 (+),score=475.03 PLAT5322.5:331-3243(+)